MALQATKCSRVGGTSSARLTGTRQSGSIAAVAQPSSPTMRPSCARGALVLVVMAALLAGPLWAAGAAAQHREREREATLKSRDETTPPPREIARTPEGELAFPELHRDNYIP